MVYIIKATDIHQKQFLSHSFFKKNKEEFYKFYWDKMICTSAKPNITHYKLAELEEEGKLSAIITQNIDGLHQLAGSKKVLELHGSCTVIFAFLVENLIH